MAVALAVECARALVARLEADAALHEAASFVARVAALDALEQVRMTGLPDTALVLRVDALERWLAAADARLFTALRRDVRAGDYAAFRQCVARVASQLADDADGDPGYDALDLLLNGLLEGGAAPGDAATHDAEMVFYQPTPARVVLELTERVKPTADDIFVDLGSGLGQVPILLHLLTGIPAHGVEIEAGYVRFARASAEQLGLSAVTFEQADARDADMAGGTIFYLYTPFRGAILRAVLDRLALQAQSRPITVCAYGPCATDVERETWLRRVYARGSDEGAFAVFASRR